MSDKDEGAPSTIGGVQINWHDDDMTSSYAKHRHGDREPGGVSSCCSGRTSTGAAT